MVAGMSAVVQVVEVLEEEVVAHIQEEHVVVATFADNQTSFVEIVVGWAVVMLVDWNLASNKMLDRSLPGTGKLVSDLDHRRLFSGMAVGDSMS